MQTRDVAAIILTNEHSEVLLQKKDLRFSRWPGRWSLFGGAIEKGESPETALRREILEEIGYELGTFDAVMTYDYTDVDRQGKMYVYTARFNQSLGNLSLREGAGFAFFSPEELSSLRIIEHDSKILQKFLKG